jgi:hypothetical protein
MLCFNETMSTQQLLQFLRNYENNINLNYLRIEKKTKFTKKEKKLVGVYENRNNA